MGILIGAFCASAGYERVRDTFLLFVQAENHGGAADEVGIQQYYAERDGLELTLTTESGHELPTNRIHIVNYFAEIGEIEVTIQTDLSQVYNRDVF